ncbi:hypothetical protein Syun_023542 [Stephania yunnanensis]|uniref:Purple acid phosphatase n=1 Tax=Stephania yunnanensis TaxID=152371 RepID=A0AAP0FA02_9MAGN
MTPSLGRTSVALLCVLWTLLMYNEQVPTTFAKFQTIQHPPKADGSLSLLVLGDWGRRGAYNQSQVAFQMGKIGKKLDVDFVISTGDNFYENGLKGVNDTGFSESFASIYTAPSLQKQWYSVLGNHDYRGNAEAQLDPILRKIDSRWLCMRSFVVDSEIAEFFFVDTSPFVDMYFQPKAEHHYDWRGVLPRQNYISNVLKDLKQALSESTAEWKIVVGHHAIRSIGFHGNTSELIKQLLPILNENNVDLYMNGHDHCLEHISSSKAKGSIQFLTTGAGSKAWRGNLREHEEGVKFYYDGQGFLSAELNHSEARIAYYDVFGQILHEFTLSKMLRSTI